MPFRVSQFQLRLLAHAAGIARNFARPARLVYRGRMMAASQRHDQTCGKPSGQPSEDVDKQVGENIARAMRAAGMVQAQPGAKA